MSGLLALLFVVAVSTAILAFLRWIAWRLERSSRGDAGFRFRHDPFLDRLPPHEEDLDA